MKCQVCGNENPENARFCGGCGASLNVSTASGIGIGTAELPMVSFPQAVKLGFKNYFKFSGRSSRAEYWWWFLFTVCASLILGIADSGINEFAASGQSSVLRSLFGLATLIPSLALGARRLHDIRKSGWWQLGIIFLILVGFGSAILGILVAIFGVFGDGGTLGLGLILILVGLCVLLVSMGWWILWFARKGDYGPNKYGPDPRQPTSQQPYKP